MALGADWLSVVSSVVRQSLTLVLIGLAVGLLGAFVASRVLGSLLFGVSPSDPLTAALATAVMVGVGIVAAALPALRAARVDPVVTLRSE
jgi:ABC-type antimicrobial peptide transport system permease subunit